MANVGATWLQLVSERALGLLFPPSCVVCHAEMDEEPGGVPMCEHCRDELPRISWATCERCLARVPEIPGPTADCKHCRDHKLRFDRTLALGPYDGLIRDLVLEMKDDVTGRLAQALAKLVAQEQALQSLHADVIVPIPAHSWRRWSRRADPILALATTLGRQLGMPVEPRLLEWRRDASAQVGLSQRGRFRNVQGVLRVRPTYQLDAPRVLLVDDIITTGATCSEAARALKRSGATEVKVVVVGRTTAV